MLQPLAEPDGDAAPRRPDGSSDPRALLAQRARGGDPLQIYCVFFRRGGSRRRIRLFGAGTAGEIARANEQAQEPIEADGQAREPGEERANAGAGTRRRITAGRSPDGGGAGQAHRDTRSSPGGAGPVRGGTAPGPAGGNPRRGAATTAFDRRRDPSGEPLVHECGARAGARRRWATGALRGEPRPGAASAAPTGRRAPGTRCGSAGAPAGGRA